MGTGANATGANAPPSGAVTPGRRAPPASRVRPARVSGSEAADSAAAGSDDVERYEPTRLPHVLSLSHEGGVA